MNKTLIPEDNSIESIKIREKIIRDFYREWILMGAKKVSIKKTKPGNKNQQPFERMMIMEYDVAFIGRVKMTVGIRRRTHEKVQYCITAIQSL